MSHIQIKKLSYYKYTVAEDNLKSWHGQQLTTDLTVRTERGQQSRRTKTGDLFLYGEGEITVGSLRRWEVGERPQK